MSSIERFQGVRAQIEEKTLIALDYKKRGFKDKEIAKMMYEKHDYGKKNKQGEIYRPFAPQHINLLVREALKKLAEERLEATQEYSMLLEQRYEDLYNQWEEKAGDNLKAAEFCKKVLSDLATLRGANAPVEHIVTTKVEQSFEALIPVLRKKLSDQTFIEVIKAIEEVQQEYYQHYARKRFEEKQQALLESGEVIEGEVVND